MDCVPDTCTMTNTHTPSQVLGFVLQLADAQYINRAAKRIDAQAMLFNSKEDIPSTQLILHWATWSPADLDCTLNAMIDDAKPQTKRALRAIVKRSILLK